MSSDCHATVIQLICSSAAASLAGAATSACGWGAASTAASAGNAGAGVSASGAACTPPAPKVNLWSFLLMGLPSGRMPCTVKSTLYWAVVSATVISCRHSAGLLCASASSVVLPSGCVTTAPPCLVCFLLCFVCGFFVCLFCLGWVGFVVFVVAVCCVL